MSTLVIVYVLLFSVISVGGVYDDYVSKRGAPTIILEALSGLFVISFALSYSYPFIAVFLSDMIFPMLTTAVCWDIYAGMRDVRELIADKKAQTGSEPLLFRWAIYGGLLLLNLPGYYMAYSVIS